MKLIDALSSLIHLGQPIFTTSDAAAQLRGPNAHANKILSRLTAAKHLVHLKRGRWALADQIHLFSLPEFLTIPFPSYVSLQSALNHHGMISQIPAITYAVSLARTRRYETPIGVISIHHIQPALFSDFEIDTGSGAKIATPEKALFDLCYLSPAKSRLFTKIPELELTPTFNTKVALGLTKKISFPRRRTLVCQRMVALLKI
jgi:predicted transcriptional regulator of viral defense system